MRGNVWRRPTCKWSLQAAHSSHGCWCPPNWEFDQHWAHPLCHCRTWHRCLEAGETYVCSYHMVLNIVFFRNMYENAKTKQHKFYEFANCAHSTGWWTPWPWHLPERKVFAGHAYLIWRWCLAEWNSLSWTSWNFNAKTFRENDLLKFNVFTMAMSMPLSLHGRHWTWVKLDLSAYKCVIINAPKRKNV